MEKSVVWPLGGTLDYGLDGRGWILIAANPARDLTPAPVEAADSDPLDARSRAAFVDRNQKNITRIVPREAVGLGRAAIPGLGRDLYRAVPIAKS